MSAKNAKYWEFKMQAGGKEADLYLYMQIQAWGAGYSAHSAKSFKQELDDLGTIDKLNIYVNCEGGDVFEGYTIANMLRRATFEKVAYVDGLAASIATDILTVMDKVYMYNNSMQMIHRAWGGCCGTSDDLRKHADMLDKINESVKQDYLDKAQDKLDDATITKIMEDETWLTAQECFDYGLCDEILTSNAPAAQQYTNETFEMLNYKNVPQMLLKQHQHENTAQMDLIRRIREKYTD